MNKLASSSAHVTLVAIAVMTGWCFMVAMGYMVLCMADFVGVEVP